MFLNHNVSEAGPTPVTGWSVGGQNTILLGPLAELFSVLTSSVRGANRVGLCPPTGHMKTEVEPASEILWFKNTLTMDIV
jgi:hypothetical protein